MDDTLGLSLPQLQSFIKKDPDSYEEDFKRQFEHFESKLEGFRLNPQKVQTTFAELISFLAQTSPCYAAKNEKAANFAKTCIDLLNELGNVLHHKTRECLVNSLKLLRNRNQISTMALLPTWFALFSSNDKTLRRSLIRFIVRDIQMLFQATRDLKVHNELKKYMYQKYADERSPESQSRKAARIIIQLYHKRVWTDRKTINYIALGTLAKDQKVSMACANFLLGTGKLMGQSDSEDSDYKEAQEKLAENIVSKNTKNREQKLEREKDLARKFLARQDRKRAEEEARVFMPALDQLDNPEGLCERLMDRITKRSVAFKLRLVLLDLVSRVAGRYELQVPSFYSALMRYIRPTQNGITKVLATAAQAAHPMVPPDDILPAVLGIYRQFVTESQPPQVITVGINAICAICDRCPFAMDKDTLAGICEFKEMKDKSVVMALRRIVNLYRDRAPELLPKDMRGKEASIAMHDGTAAKLAFGAQKVDETIPGIELLMLEKKYKQIREEKKRLEQQEMEAAVGGDDDEEEFSDWSVDEDLLQSDSDSDASSGDEKKPKAVKKVAFKGDKDAEEASGSDGDAEDDEEDEEDGDDEDEGEDEDEEAPRKKAKIDSPPRPTRVVAPSATAAAEAAAAFSHKAGIAAMELLTEKDFAELRRLQEKRDHLKQLARGNARERREAYEMLEREKKKAIGALDSDDESTFSMSGSEVDIEEELSDFDPELDLATKRARVGAIEPDELKGFSREKMNKAQRVARMREGKTDQAEMVKSKLHKDVATHSLPESVKRRNKPMAMVRMKFDNRAKNRAALKVKVSNLRKHVDNLKKTTGGNIKRRRG